MTETEKCTHPAESVRREGFNGAVVGGKTMWLKCTCLRCGAMLPLDYPGNKRGNDALAEDDPIQ